MPSPLPRGDEGEEAYEECLTPSKGGRFKFGQRKKVITAAKPPPPLAKPGVDAWAQEFYDGHRRTLLEMGVVKLLVGIIFDGTAMDASVDDQRSNVVFHALESLLELIKHNCCAEKDLNAMLPACAGVLSHANIGVAVMASFCLAAIVESPIKAARLFADKDRAYPAVVTPMTEEPLLRRFRRAGRMVLNMLSFIDGVSHADQDTAVQAARLALR